jgi:hypothetical protein
MASSCKSSGVSLIHPSFEMVTTRGSPGIRKVYQKMKYPFFVASMVYAGGSSVQYFPAYYKRYNKRVLGRVATDVDTFFLVAGCGF